MSGVSINNSALPSFHQVPNTYHLLVEHEKEQLARQSDAGNRGDTDALQASCQCLCMIWGCKPNIGIASNSTMVSEIVDRFLTCYDQFTMELAFPDCLRDLEGFDADFEVVTS